MSIDIQFTRMFEGVKTTLRWYLTSEKLNKYRGVCKGECRYKLLTEADAMLPFQVYTQLSPPHTITWEIRDDDGNVVWTPSTSLLQLVSVDDYWYYIYKGGTFGIALPSGYMHSVITIQSGADIEEWISEDFYVYNSCPNPLDLSAGFSFDPCLDVTVGTDANSFCADATECDPETYYVSTLLGVATTPLTYYKLLIEVTSISGGNAPQILVIVGGGDSYGISAVGTYEVNLLSGYAGDITIGVVGGAVVCFTIKGIVEYSTEAGCVNVLEWWQDCGIAGEIVYGNTEYKNKFILGGEIEIVNATPIITTEGFENGDNDIITTFQRRVTKYTMDLGLIPPYLYDALAEMSMHKFIKLSLQGNHGSDYIKNVVVKGEYNELGGGCFALVSLEFELADTTVLTRCCDSDIDEDPCIDNSVIVDDWTLGAGWERCPCVGDFEQYNLSDEWFCGASGDTMTTTNNDNSITNGKRYRVTVGVTEMIGASATDGIHLDVGGSDLEVYCTSDPSPTTKTQVFEITATVDNELSFNWIDPINTQGCVKISICELVTL